MDEKLKLTLQKIKILSEQNPEFAQEIRRMFCLTSPESVLFIPENLSENVYAIREALEIRANKSVSYDFIKEERLRDQLIIDNLRMENASLNLTQSEEERFYAFCVNAFYQLENIVNYYFHLTYPKIEDLLLVLEQNTEKESNDKFRYKRTGKEKNIADIQVVHKINALCNILFPGEQIKWLLGTLRQVRNEGEHRCMVIQQEKDESNNLYKFFKKNTFNSVRIALIKVVNAIKENIGKPITPKTECKEAIITSILPGACYVLVDNQSEQLPIKLLSKVKDVQKGDTIILSISDNRIIDVLPQKPNS